MLLHIIFGVFAIIILAFAQDGNVGRRAPSFVGTRGKKGNEDMDKEVAAFDFGPVQDKLDDHNDDTRNSMPKRTQFGFQGTRGKKMYDASPKRNMGFTGTRGKKEDSYFYPKLDLDDYWLIRNELAKRKFYGTRGKKLPYAYNIFGVRGKKGPSTSAFFGTRGKKSKQEIGYGLDDNADNEEALMYLVDCIARHHAYDDMNLENNDVGADFQLQDIQSGGNEEYSA